MKPRRVRSYWNNAVGALARSSAGNRDRRYDHGRRALPLKSTLPKFASSWPIRLARDWLICSIVRLPDLDAGYQIEGIGGSDWPGIVSPRRDRRCRCITDEESFAMTRRLIKEEGLLVGGSSGTAVVAALRVAARGCAGPGGCRCRPELVPRPFAAVDAAVGLRLCGAGRNRSMRPLRSLLVLVSTGQNRLRVFSPNRRRSVVNALRIRSPASSGPGCSYRCTVPPEHVPQELRL